MVRASGLALRLAVAVTACALVVRGDEFDAPTPRPAASPAKKPSASDGADPVSDEIWTTMTISATAFVALSLLFDLLRSHLWWVYGPSGIGSHLRANHTNGAYDRFFDNDNSTTLAFLNGLPDGQGAATFAPQGDSFENLKTINIMKGTWAFNQWGVCLFSGDTNNRALDALTCNHRAARAGARERNLERQLRGRLDILRRRVRESLQTTLDDVEGLDAVVAGHASE